MQDGAKLHFDILDDFPIEMDGAQFYTLVDIWHEEMPRKLP